MPGSDLDETSQLVKSNHLLTDLEMATIEHGIPSRMDEVAVPKHPAQQLKSEAKAPRSFQPLLRRIDIPYDIHAEIFTSIVASVANDRLVPAQVIAICLVCKHWRHVALSLPYLWSRISFVVKHQEDELPAGLQQWIERARNFPKVLRIAEKTDVHEFFPGQPCPLRNLGLARLLAKTPSVASLTIDAYAISCLQTLIVDLVAPIVREGDGEGWVGVQGLGLKVKEWGDDTPELESTMEGNHFFQYLPSVSSLSLSLLPWYEDAPDFATNPPRLSLTNLTRLDLACDWNIDWVIGSLSTCKKLEEMTLDFMELGGYNVDLGTGGLTTGSLHPRMRTLRLRGLLHHSDKGEAEILPFLKMPSLEHLDISYWNCLDSTEAILSSKLPRDLQACVLATCGGQTVCSLRLHSVYLNESTLRVISSGFPSLVHLILEDIVCDSTMFKVAAAENMFPQLEVLEVLQVDSAEFNLDFDCDDILKFFQARRPYGGEGKLKKVVVTINRQEDIDNIEGVIPDWLGSEGLEYTVSLVDRRKYWDVAVSSN